MATPEFGTIKPGDIDWFEFDITNQIGDTSPATIQNVSWICTVSPESSGQDSSPEQHVIDSMYSDTKAAVKAGNFIDGVIYTLTASITLTDGREFNRLADVLCSLRPSPEVEIPLTVQYFRVQFPAFNDVTQYPDEQVDFWIDQAINFSPLNSLRAGQFYDRALRFWVAHNLALERAAARVTAGGAAPLGSGVPQSKSVNGVSISYDTEFGAMSDAGSYNLTTYGQRFFQILKMAGGAGSVVPSGYPPGTVFQGLGTIPLFFGGVF